MSTIRDILEAATVEPCRPWPRYSLSESQWSALIQAPRPLLAVWADTQQVHALFGPDDDVFVASVTVAAASYPALSPHHPGAAWFERAIRDLWGHVASGGDERPWLDHGHWPHARPLAIRPGPRPPTADPPEFQDVPGDALMQWPIGPLGSGVGEPWHLRLTLAGTRIVRAESRLGYGHKGTLTLMRAKSPRIAARFAARLAADCTVAHSLAFAAATEAALAVEAPPRAAALRTLMATFERIGTHLDDLATLAGLLGAAHLHGRCGVRQEYLRRGLAITFGHRLLMDCVVPGGVAADVDANGLSGMRQILGGLEEDMPAIRRLFAADAVAARLNGLGAGAGVGDAASRCRRRLDAVADAAAAAIALMANLPEGPLSVALPQHSGEGLAHSRSARGDIWHWLRLDHGQIAAVFVRDPGWTLWPLAETVLAGAEAGDAAMICCSLGLPASGMDL